MVMSGIEVPRVAKVGDETVACSSGRPEIVVGGQPAGDSDEARHSGAVGCQPPEDGNEAPTFWRWR